MVNDADQDYDDDYAVNDDDCENANPCQSVTWLLVVSNKRCVASKSKRVSLLSIVTQSYHLRHNHY